jgi:hypothetical protein
MIVASENRRGRTPRIYEQARQKANYCGPQWVLAYAAALTPAKGRLIPHVTLFPRPPKAPGRLRAYKTSARPRWGLLFVGMTSAP